MFWDSRLWWSEFRKPKGREIEEKKIRAKWEKDDEYEIDEDSEKR